MDSSLKNLLRIFCVLISFLFAMLLVLGLFFAYSTINTYHRLLLFFMIMIIIVIAIFIITVLSALYVYRKKEVNPVLLWPVRASVRVVLPFIIFISGFLRGNIDAIRRLYISVNNILVRYGDISVPPQKILILIPHCLQYYGCEIKVTSNTGNCRRCGRCNIGDIIEIAEEYKVQVAIATGGTAARSLVRRLKPGLIIAVACERDLTSGISDIENIPVVGFTNERPNGPCYNTTVDVHKLREYLQKLLGMKDERVKIKDGC